MTSPSVVILTEPANCGLADRYLLLQALLEAQELSREGVPVFQAFCDNPAAAEAFIDAYATAYPTLQLQSPDLPLPEQLYSMMADGRLTPLRGLELAQDSTKLEGGTKLHPLLVLSLGTPDAVMQALQGNRFVKSSINVVEIAPVEEPRSASVPVAAAVAAHVAAGPSWTPDTSSPGSPDEEGALSPADEAANAPLKLDSAELNLEKISIDHHGEQAQRSPPAAAMIDMSAGISIDAGATRPVDAEVRVAESGNAASPASEPGSGPAPESYSTAAPAPVSVSSAAPDATAVTSAEPESVGSDRSPGQAETSSATSVTPSSPPPEVGAETPPQAPGGNDEDPSQTVAENAPGDSLPEPARVSDGTGEDNAASPARSAADGDITEPTEDLVYDGSSFSEPGEDVVYSPTGSFTSDGDTPYPLPLAAVAEVDDFAGGVLPINMADDIVDVEAISSAGADHPALTSELFDPILMRVGGPDGLGAHAPYDASQQNADPSYLDSPMPDPDNHQDGTITPVHDLDI